MYSEEIITKEEKVEIVSLDKMHNQINQLVDEGRLEEALKLSEKLRLKLEQEYDSMTLHKDEYLSSALPIELEEKVDNNLSGQSELQEDNHTDEKEEKFDLLYIEKKLKEIKKLTKINKTESLERALLLCDIEDLKVEIQKILILIRLNRLFEALDVCNKEKYQTNEYIQLQKIKILIQLDKQQEALKICERKEFISNIAIQSQRIKILQTLDRKKEAIEVCKMKEICNNESIKILLSNIEKNLSNDSNDEEPKLNINITEILTRIYCNDISLEEIESMELANFDKILLTIAYYEKNNKKNGIIFIKNKKISYGNGKKLKILNLLLQRLLNKKIKIFDPTIYGKYLNCSINFDLANELLKKKTKSETILNKKDIQIESNEISKVELSTEKQISPVVEEQSQIVVEKNQESKKMIVSEGKRVTSRNSVNNETLEKNNQVIEKEILIKDLFNNELIEIGKYVYTEMYDISTQKKAIKAWDKLEELANQPVSDKDKLKRMIFLIERLNGKNGIELSVDEKRYSKYL